MLSSADLFTMQLGMRALAVLRAVSHSRHSTVETGSESRKLQIMVLGATLSPYLPEGDLS